MGPRAMPTASACPTSAMFRFAACRTQCRRVPNLRGRTDHTTTGAINPFRVNPDVQSQGPAEEDRMFHFGTRLNPKRSCRASTARSGVPLFPFAERHFLDRRFASILARFPFFDRTTRHVRMPQARHECVDRPGRASPVACPWPRARFRRICRAQWSQCPVVADQGAGSTP